MRDGIDVLRLALFIGALVALALGAWASALTLGLGFVITLLGRLAQLPRPFDLLLVVAVSADIWGDVANLYESVGWYDYVIHFLLPMAVAAGLYVLFARLGAVPDLAEATTWRQRLGVALITWTIGLSVGTIYEMYEYGVVRYLGMDLNIGYSDTISDLLDNAIGALAGALLLVLWAVRGWSTERRLRGRRLARGRLRGLVGLHDE